MKHHLIDRTFLVYTVIAVLCWGIGTGLMFLLYNCLHVGYWLASACNYLVGGTMAYFLNRKYTFHSQENRFLVGAKYVLHMAACYLISYSLAPVVTAYVLDHWSLHAKGNLSLAVGSVTFTVLNYFGQRYLVFRRPGRKRRAGKP